MTLAAAMAIAIPFAVTPLPASAEGLFDFFFGGTSSSARPPPQASFFADPFNNNPQPPPRPRAAVASGPVRPSACAAATASIFR